MVLNKENEYKTSNIKISYGYIDNKEMYRVIKEYKEACKEAEVNKKPKPQIPNYIGNCIYLIANRLSMKPCFANYSYREEMIGDGIENSIRYFDNFDPALSENPFSYFTQIIYFAFLRRLRREKKQTYIKHKLAVKHLVDHDMYTNDGDDDHEVRIATTDDRVHDFIKDFEDDLKERSAKSKKRQAQVETEEDENTDTW